MRSEAEVDRLSGDERWKLAQRVAASETFQRSRRARELLLYLCEQGLLNRAENLREQAIGCNVFGRRPDYNPGEDNIVRVEVRHLRKRLEEFFAAEGRTEPLALTIPKGSYQPSFEAQPLASTPEPPAPRRFRLRIGRRTAVAAAAVAVAAAIVILGTNAYLSGSAASGRGPLLPLLFNAEDETLVVCADSALVLAETITGKAIPLEDYIKRDYGAAAAGYASNNAAHLLQLTSRWQFTDIADARIVGALARVNSAYWHRVSVRPARNIQLQDFKAGNVIILGSTESNPWGRAFQDRLNFVIEDDYLTHRSTVRNKAPRPGELGRYSSISMGDSGESFCTIAMLPNLRRTGRVLLIAGTTGEGTETAGEFIANPEASAGLTRSLLAAGHGSMPYFEALLRSRAVAGVPSSPEVVTFRVVPAAAGER